MARKAKRRGRPPGSKNKKTLGKSLATMDVAQLRAHIDQLQALLGKKVQEQRSFFERQLAQLGGYASKKATAAFASVSSGRRGGRAKPKPKYQSKKDKSLRWTGRGMTPVWMRDEMKGTKLTKESFLIK